MAGDLTSRLIVRLIDGVSAPAAKAAVALRGLVGVSEKAAVAGRGTGKAVARDIGMVNRGVQRLTSSASMPLGILGAMGARTVYEYEKVGNALQAVTGLTREQRREVEDLAKTLNKKFPARLDEIMGGAFELGRAGLKFDEILGSLEGTLQLSLAGDIEIPRTADIVTNIATAMRLPMKGVEQAKASLQRINDVVAFTATSSNTDVGLMGDTFKYVAPIAAAAGVSIEEISAATLVLAQGGVRGAEAGVALRSALVRMVKPSLDARQAMAELGLSFEDFADKWRELNVDELASGMKNIGFDISKVLPKIREGLGGLSLETDRGLIHETITDAIIKGLGVKRQTDQEKVAKAVGKYVSGHIQGVDLMGLFDTLVEKDVAPGQMSRIFDQRQGTRLSNLLRPGEDSTSALMEALEEVKKSFGEAERMAIDRMDGIVGQVNRLTSAWVELNEAIARSGVLATVGDAFDRMAASLNKLSGANPQLLRIGTYAALAVIALAPLGMAFTAIGGLAGFATGAIGLLGSSLAVLSGPAMLAIGLMGALAYAVWSNWDQVSAVLSFYREKLADVGSAIGEFVSSIGTSIREGIVAAAEWVGEAIVGLRDKIVTHLSNSLEAIGRIDLSSAGAAIMRSLWEGMKSIFNGLVGWVSAIPAATRFPVVAAVRLHRAAALRLRRVRAVVRCLVVGRISSASTARKFLRLGSPATSTREHRRAKAACRLRSIRRSTYRA